MRVTGSVVFGIILLILGIILLLANIFGFKINFFRLFPGVILLILGIIIIFGQFGGRHEVIFDRKTIDLNEPYIEKNIIFAEGEINLNDLEQLESGKKMKINVIFGSGKLVLNPEISTVVNASTVFGSLELPQRTVNFIGSTNYRFGDFQPEQPFLDIEINVIFGQLKTIKS
jgi:energy-coupling factor transporter transmembrane protein EcfT